MPKLNRSLHFIRETWLQLVFDRGWSGAVMLVVRWLGGGFFAGLAALTFVAVVKLMQEGEAGAVGLAMALLAFFILVTASVGCFAPDLALVVFRPVTRWIDDVLFPSEQLGAPPLNYRLARLYGREMEWEKAEAQYRQMARDYPLEVELYREWLVVSHHLGRAALESPEEIIKRARRRLSPGEAKAVEEVLFELVCGENPVNFVVLAGGEG